MVIWDNIKIWKPPYLFSFVPAVVQHCFGKLDSKGNEVYQGNVKVMVVSDFLFQKTIWDAAVSF